MDGDEVIETKNSNSDCRSSETTPPPRPIDVTEYIISLELKSVKFKKDEHGHFKCPEKACGYRNKSLAIITRHYRKHTGEKPFQCKLCDRKFAYRKLKCPRCEANFATNQYLKKHISQFHYRPLTVPAMLLKSPCNKWLDMFSPMLIFIICCWG